MIFSTIFYGVEYANVVFLRHKFAKKAKTARDEGGY
jgi:hypothetical protein